MGIGQSPLTPARDTGPLKQRAVGLLAACSIVLALTGCGNAAAPTPQPTVTEPLPSAAEGVDVVSASGIVVPYREAVLNIRERPAGGNTGLRRSGGERRSGAGPG